MNLNELISYLQDLQKMNLGENEVRIDSVGMMIPMTGARINVRVRDGREVIELGIHVNEKK